ncbi:hypothetical protein RNJ44_01452 [Nakaseomyces bracarensis]|uniref:Oligopeptide transporter n=1 Tax=Nakaseomyces bracarensis TaxID=273131 RepID=A0ABR4NPR2_9SACH
MLYENGRRFTHLTTNTMNSDSSTRWADKPAIKQITLRGTIAGIFIGSLVLISNFQFGLQTGWVSMMSLPSALLACAIFRQVWPYILPNDPPFTDVEAVYVQSMAVAIGTGPLALGFVGVIPAIEKFLTFEESGGTRAQGEPFSLAQLLLWSGALTYFGIFFAVPLRKQVIVREKLPFPSGSATATLIAVLNGTEILQEVSRKEIMEMRKRRLQECPEVLRPDSDSDENEIENDNYMPLLNNGNLPNYNTNTNEASTNGNQLYNKNIKLLSRMFIVSSIYTVATYFLPMVKEIPFLGRKLSDRYLWNMQPSPAYFGQGIIMGLPTVSYMLFGCILGWGILAPYAVSKGWVLHEEKSWDKGVQGWVLWCSLAIMITDSLVGFIVMTTNSLLSFFMVDDRRRMLSNIIDDSFESMILEEEEAINKMKSVNNLSSAGTVRLVSRDVEHEVDQKHLVKYTTVLSGIVISSILCVVLVIYIFGAEIIPAYSMVLALFIALFLSILGIRALGETDLNPVSGIGKISQLFFALIIPKDNPAAVLINLVAGGIAEAGAQQAGDLMQDLKTGHLLGASPKAQFMAQLIGVTWSMILSSFMYMLYNKVYTIPSTQFRIPTASVWIDCARLVTGKDLPKGTLECSIVLASIFALLSLIKNCYRQREYWWLKYVPSGVAVGIGIFNSPSFTIARFIGGLAAHMWLTRHRGKLDSKTTLIVCSSGLILGEGICSLLNILMTTIRVPHF